MRSWEKAFEKKVTEWSERFFFQAMDNPEIKMHLFFYPSTETHWGILETYSDEQSAGNGMEYLAVIPRNKEYRQFRQWLRDIVWRLPILPQNNF